MKEYIETKLNIKFKDNWQIFKVDSRGIDFAGYRVYHTHVLLRKTIKKNFCRKISKLNRRDDLSKSEYK
jgi:hypothetical protein